MIAVVASPVFVYSVTRITRRIKETARAQRSREGSVAATTAEIVSAIKTVQSLSLQNVFAGIFAANNTRSLQAGARAQQLSAGLERTVEVMVAVITAVVLWGGAQAVISKSLTPGDLIVFVNYMRTASRPMRQLAKSLGQIARALASGERILELMHTVPEIRDSENAVELQVREGRIRFEDVSFSYEPGRLVLDGFNLDIRPGQHVAVVGPSGSGKSTIANLLLRFYDPDAGRVLVDGHDVRDCKLDSLRSQTSIVLQDSVLFAVSARENIRAGAARASDADLLVAARMANAHEFLTRLPQGYETVLGERGATLSGGQRQRIAIARAAVREAPIVILDEPTTGLDGQNESEVMTALERLTAARTTLLISHNLKMARQADLIVYLAHGRVLEQGTHQELMALGGEYATTYILQNSSDKENYYAVET
jgi:ATP-binding cassette subfamily B protein